MTAGPRTCTYPRRSGRRAGSAGAPTDNAGADRGGTDIPWCGASSRGGALGPGGVFAIGGSGLQAAVQDADEAVGQLAEGGVVSGAAGAEGVVVGAGAG